MADGTTGLSSAMENTHSIIYYKVLNLTVSVVCPEWRSALRSGDSQQTFEHS